MKFFVQRKSAKSWLLVSALSLVLLVVVTVMAMAAGNKLDKNGIAAMIPKNSVGFFMLDTPWWYQNIVSIKDQQGKLILNDNKEFQKFEEENGISIEKDIMSWAGRVGVCLLSIKETEPTELVMPPLEGDAANEEVPDDFEGDTMATPSNYDAAFAVLLEVQNRAMFLAKLPGLMQKMPAGENDITWKEDFYAGISIRRSEVDFEGMMRPLALAEVNGWLVFAVGDKSMEKIIDTVNGKIPAFSDIPGMKDTLAQLPENTYTLFGFNGDSDVQISQFPTAQLAGMAGVVSYSETENGLQLSSTSLATTDASKKELKRYQTMLKPPAGKALTLLPAGTFAVMSFSNPGAILTEIKKNMLAGAESDNMRQMYEQTFAQMQPLQDMLNNITGEVAISAAWSKDDAVGFSLVGEHASAAKVAETSKKLKEFLAEMGLPISNQNGMNVLPQMADAEHPLQPAWMIKNTTRPHHF